MTFCKQVAVTVLAALAATGVAAQQAPTETAVFKREPGKVSVSDVVTVTAVVTAIDAATRAVTLKGPQGNSYRVVAGPDVRNFAQIKVGDELVVTHVEALSLELKKGGAGIRSRVDSDTAARAPAGDRPGVAGMHTVTITADVIAVNARTRMVTLRGPERMVDLRVEDPEQFKLIKVGDQVVARYSEALAISMQPAR